MKLILIAIFLIAGISLATPYSSYWGNRNYNDQLLAREPVLRYAKRNTAWSVTVEYPRWGSSSSAIISAVDVVDGFRNNSGPYNTLLSGGPGYGYVKVNLRSQNSHGINATVSIWGKFR